MYFVDVAVFFDEFLRLDEHDGAVRFDEGRLLRDLRFAYRDHGVVVFLRGRGREMLDEREVREHDLLDDVGELWVEEVVAEQGNAGADERDELRAHVGDRDHETFQEIRDEELIRQGLHEFESNLFDAILLDVRRVEEDYAEHVEQLHLHHEVFVRYAVAENRKQRFQQVLAQRKRERRVFEMRDE